MIHTRLSAIGWVVGGSQTPRPTCSMRAGLVDVGVAWLRGHFGG